MGSRKEEIWVSFSNSTEYMLHFRSRTNILLSGYQFLNITLLTVSSRTIISQRGYQLWNHHSPYCALQTWLWLVCCSTKRPAQVLAWSWLRLGWNIKYWIHRNNCIMYQLQFMSKSINVLYCEKYPFLSPFFLKYL